MKGIKRLMAALLAVAIMVSALSVSAFAANPTVIIEKSTSGGHLSA